MKIFRFPARLALGAALAVAAAAILPRPAAAAAAHDNCTDFVDSLPATISTPGVWCLRGNLSMALTWGAAIDVLADDVVLDCKQFKLGGLPAGPNTQATGIRATARAGITVRNCQVRGFFVGIELGGEGHLVERNLVEGSLHHGISALGGNNLVRHNRVLDTGDNQSNSVATGILVSGDALGNTIDGLRSRNPAIAALSGISATGDGAVVRDNVIRGFVQSTSTTAVGIKLQGMGIVASGNHVQIDFPVAEAAIRNYGGPNTLSVCRGNTTLGFTPGVTCNVMTGNLGGP